MRGSSAFIIGLLIVVMITVIFLIDKNLNYSRHVSIASSSVQLYLVENDAESIKRSLDSVVYFSSLSALKELFSESEEWTADDITESEFFSRLDKKLSEKINALAPSTVGKNVLQWSDASVKSMILSDAIEISGQKNFIIQNKVNPKFSLEVPGAFDRKIKTDAKNIFSRARSFFGPVNWKIDKTILESEGEKCTGKISDAAIQGGFYNKKINDTISTVVMCGYGSEPGALSEKTYNRDSVSEKISKSLNSFAADLKPEAGTGNVGNYDYKFSHEISSQKSGSAEKVTVVVIVSITNQTSFVPDENNFAPLTLQFKNTAEFEMPAAQT